MRAGVRRVVAPPLPGLLSGRAARRWLDGRVVGWLGELHPRWAQQIDLAHAPVVFEIDMAAIDHAALVRLSEFSRQPVVVRDLAVWEDAQVHFQAMFDTLAQTVASDDNLDIVRDIRLFDIWRDTSEIGRASCRERVCQYVLISVVAVSLK